MFTPDIMKKIKRTLPLIMAAVLTCSSLPLVAQADSSKVVTLGANLTEEQKTSMYEYFGTSADEVDTIEVTNADERKYMEGIASEEQIGTRTYSCSYVEPTSSGGVQVKVANLTYVTSSMIASTLLTSGVENCNVVAASPIEVSGTGALTGIMMAYEQASGEALDEGQKEAATQELITTGELADTIGQEQASDLMNEVKEDVIDNNLTDEGEIQDAVNNAADKYNITLSEGQMAQIVSLMQTISQYDYDTKALKKTLDNLNGESGGFFSNLWNSIKGIFGGSDSSDGGIINNTDDSALGDDVVSNSTLDSSDNSSSNNSDSADNSSDSSSDDNSDDSGFWGKIKKFFKDLFGGSDSKKDNSDKSKNDANTEDSKDTDDDQSDDTQNDSLNSDADSSDAGTTDNSADDSSLNNSADDQSDTQSSLPGSSESDSSNSNTSDSTANGSAN